MTVAAAFMVPHPPMIIPQIGRGEEAQIAETIRAYEKAAEEIAAEEPDTIVIASPHTVMYMDYFHISPGHHGDGSFARFGAPEVSFHELYDTELVRQIDALAEERGFPAGTLGEEDPELDHGTMVPLYFIRKKYQKGRIVRVGLSGLPLEDHYRLGQLIREAGEKLGRRIVFVASGDLSHRLQEYGPYGFAAEGPVYDERIMDVCSRASFGELFDFDEDFCRKAGECGHRAFVMMAGALDGMSVTARQLSHQDVTGVGYGVCTFHPGGTDSGRRFLDRRLAEREAALAEKRASEDAFVSLARQSLEHYVRTGRPLEMPADLPAELTDARAGAFVSLHEHGQLRGCIGTIQPVSENLAREIIRNAVSAGTEDPRFRPVTEEELKWIEISVDVLGEPEDIDSPAELDPRRYGVIVSNGGRRGLLLPDLEGVDTAERQISIARAKAGISPGEPVELKRFEVVRHGKED